MSREEGRENGLKDRTRLRAVEMLQLVGHAMGMQADYSDKDEFIRVFDQAFDEGFRTAEAMEVVQ